MTERVFERRASRIGAVLRSAALCMAVTCAVAGRAAPSPAGAAASGGDAAATLMRPELRWLTDAPLLGAGVSLLAVGGAMSTATRFVPPTGLDRGQVHWSFDRAQIGNHDTRANDQSDYTLSAATAYPLAVAFAFQPSGTRASGTLRRSAVYTEAVLIGEGICSVIKKSADRPRPYTYLPVGQRPGDPGYDVTKSDAFQSMPSGHSTGAFCGAAFAMTDNLLSRPQAGWLERAGVPFAGGVLAGMTAAMRVEAGKHFPSDVIVGGSIGTACGVAVPLVHHYLGAHGRRAPLPSGRAWGQAAAGLFAGVGTGILIAQASH